MYICVEKVVGYLAKERNEVLNTIQVNLFIETPSY